jgi:hypothetical protein
MRGGHIGAPKSSAFSSPVAMVALTSIPAGVNVRD